MKSKFGKLLVMLGVIEFFIAGIVFSEYSVQLREESARRIKDGNIQSVSLPFFGYPSWVSYIFLAIFFITTVMFMITGYLLQQSKANKKKT